MALAKDTTGAIDLSAYLNSSKHKDKVKLLVEPVTDSKKSFVSPPTHRRMNTMAPSVGMGLKNALRDQRAFSIADSEIQKVEVGGILLADPSKASLSSIPNQEKRGRNLSFVQGDIGKSIQYLPSLPQIESRVGLQAEMKIRENPSVKINKLNEPVYGSSTDLAGPTGPSSHGTGPDGGGHAMSRMFGGDSKVSLGEVRIRMPEGSTDMPQPDDSRTINRNPFSTKFEKAEAM